MGILESIAEQLRQLQEAVSLLTERSRASENRVSPMAADEEVWADGAMDLATASKFSGISRNELYVLMRSGDLPFAVATRERLVPRRWLVQYLAKCVPR